MGLGVWETNWILTSLIYFREVANFKWNFFFQVLISFSLLPPSPALPSLPSPSFPNICSGSPGRSAELRHARRSYSLPASAWKALPMPLGSGTRPASHPLQRWFLYQAQAEQPLWRLVDSFPSQQGGHFLPLCKACSSSPGLPSKGGIPVRRESGSRAIPDLRARPRPPKGHPPDHGLCPHSA